LHAERKALRDCIARGESAQGATAYVTLEPCAHTGKTPPCTEALIAAGVKRVVVGSRDPNPLVAGAGVAALQSAGIEVLQDCARSLCDSINQPFFHFITTRTPFVIAKYACTLDGKIATSTGKSKWITSEIARQRVHVDRARAGAIMVGVGTVLADDPLLNARPENPQALSPKYGIHQPLRVILDTHLKIDTNARVVQTAKEFETVVFTCASESQKIPALLRAGVQVVLTSKNNAGSVCLENVMSWLAHANIDSVIIEGGPTLLGAAFDAHLPNAVQAFVAPKLFGGTAAPGPVAGVGASSVAGAVQLTHVKMHELGPDFLIEGLVKYVNSQNEE
jgi:diaminohydroxyphosphoribosylaminopyrimidine deaminase/5-amino-6-(5-phosphoribosylamino)uracil reductase